MKRIIYELKTVEIDCTEGSYCGYIVKIEDGGIVKIINEEGSIIKTMTVNEMIIGLLMY